MTAKLLPMNSTRQRHITFKVPSRGAQKKFIESILTKNPYGEHTKHILM